MAKLSSTTIDLACSPKRRPSLSNGAGRLLLPRLPSRWKRAWRALAGVAVSGAGVGESMPRLASSLSTAAATACGFISWMSKPNLVR